MLTWPTAGETISETAENVHWWALQHFRYVEDAVRWKNDPDLKFDERWEKDSELLEDLEARGFVEGDCDAFAKMCWMAMRRLSAPARLVFCQLFGGGYHLVCEAEGWIMDNRQRGIMSRDELAQNHGYTWISKSGYLPGEQWTTAY